MNRIKSTAGKMLLTLLACAAVFAAAAWGVKVEAAQNAGSSDVNGITAAKKVPSDQEYTFEEPFKIKIGTNYTGDLKEDNQQDWFRLTVKESIHITWEITNKSGHYLDCRLYNTDLSGTYENLYISSGTKKDPEKKNVTLALGPGVYYLRIYGSSGKYSFKVREVTYVKYLMPIKITAKAGEKKMVVETTPQTKLTVKIGSKTYKKTTSVQGKATIKLKKKLKKNQKIVVTGKKTGYHNKTKTYKVKAPAKKKKTTDTTKDSTKKTTKDTTKTTKTKTTRTTTKDTTKTTKK